MNIRQYITILKFKIKNFRSKKEYKETFEDVIENIKEYQDTEKNKTKRVDYFYENNGINIDSFKDNKTPKENIIHLILCIMFFAIIIGLKTLNDKPKEYKTETNYNYEEIEQRNYEEKKRKLEEEREAYMKWRKEEKDRINEKYKEYDKPLYK